MVIKQEVTRKQCTPNFPKKEHFLPPNYFSSGGKKYSFFGKIGVHCFLVNSVLRFALLLYYRWNYTELSLRKICYKMSFRWLVFSRIRTEPKILVLTREFTGWRKPMFWNILRSVCKWKSKRQKLLKQQKNQAMLSSFLTCMYWFKRFQHKFGSKSKIIFDHFNSFYSCEIHYLDTELSKL